MRLLAALFLLSASVAYGQCTFSPAAGTYTTPQNVTVTCPAGLTAFYTTDGSTPSIAGTPYTAPIPVNATTTLKVIAAKVGVMVQNAGTTSSQWKCVTPTATTYGSLSCQASAGVGSINPSNVVWTFGTPMVETVSTTASTGETQMLFIHTTPTTSCTTCTELVEDKIVQPDKGPTFVANHEMDANVNMKATYNQFHTASLQCNQQPGHNQWQIDNQQGSWQNTGITFGCPLSTTQQTEIRYGIHWVNGDTSCAGGFSCDSYDFLTICVGGTNGTGGTCHDFNLGPTILPGFTEPSFSQSMALQDQPDLTNTATCGTSPCTASRSVWKDNVTLAFSGTSVTSSALFTINTPADPAVKIFGTMQISGAAKIQ